MYLYKCMYTYMFMYIYIFKGEKRIGPTAKGEFIL